MVSSVSVRVTVRYRVGVSFSIRVTFKVTLLRLYFIHVYLLALATEPWLEQPACDKQCRTSCKLHTASCKLRKVLKCVEHVHIY